MKRVNIGIIGCGEISKTAHFPYLNKMPEVNLVAASDIIKENLEYVKKEFLVTKTYMNYKQMLDKEDIDAVFILTPTFLHKEMVIEAAKRGKHVFVEKPMSVTSREAEEMVKAARKNRVKLMVGHYLRFLSNHQHVNKMLNDGKIGNIFYIQGHSEMPFPDKELSHFFFRRDKGGGVLLDYGCHLIDLILWFLEGREVKYIDANLSSFDKRIDVETHASLIMKFNDKTLVSLSSMWVPWSGWEVYSRYIKIVGEKGRIVSELTGPSYSVYRPESFFSKVLGEAKIIPKGLHPKLPASSQGYKKEIEHFIECIMENKKPMISGEDGKRVVDIIEAAVKSDSFGHGLKVRI